VWNQSKRFIARGGIGNFIACELLRIQFVIWGLQAYIEYGWQRFRYKS
jgi:hypothetical protein